MDKLTLQLLADWFHSTSIGYVEFRTIDLVEKALALSGTVVMGLPIMVQLTESERNRLHPGDGYVFVYSLCVYLTSEQEPQSSAWRNGVSWFNAVSPFLSLDYHSLSLVVNKDYMSDLYTLTLPRPISNRCLNLLGNLNLSIFTKTL